MGYPQLYLLYTVVLGNSEALTRQNLKYYPLSVRISMQEASPIRSSAAARSMAKFTILFSRGI